MHTGQSVAAVPQNKINKNDFSETLIESTLSALNGIKAAFPKDSIEQLYVLPFIGEDRSKEDGFWKVKTTGDYMLDLELGSAYGAIYLQYCQAGGELSLYWIIESMENVGSKSAKGIAVGFLDEVRRYASHGAGKADIARTYERAARLEHTIFGGSMITGNKSTTA